MRRLTIAVLMLGLLLTSCAKRPVVHADATADLDAVRKGPTCFVLPGPVQVKTVVQDLVANFEGSPGKAIECLKTELIADLTGSGSCRSETEFGNGPPLVTFLPGTPAGRDSMLACISITLDEYGVSRPTASNPDQLNVLLAAEGADYLILLEQLELRRATTESDNVVTGQTAATQASLSGQILIWSAASRRFIFSGYVNGATNSRWIDRRALESVACSFTRDLSLALRR